MNSLQKKTILVTGANGFIGKNLVAHLSEDANLEVLKIVRSSTMASLISAIEKADVIFHLAGANRPVDPSEFEATNYFMTKEICRVLSKKMIGTKLILASSSRANENSQYGKSKLKGEKEVEKLFATKFHTGKILRLPNVFGKWSKPFYNSVVATFCYQATHDLPLTIEDEDKYIELLYIDDLVNYLADFIRCNNRASELGQYKNTSWVKLGDLARKIRSFHETRSTTLPCFESDFDRKLYSTFVSFLKEEQFAYHINRFEDQRGAFSEIWKTVRQGQFSVFTVLPNSERGNHFHHSKVERFLLVHGRVEYLSSSFDEKDTFAICLTDRLPSVIESIPGWSHKFVNSTNEIAVVLAWANEIYDPEHPDTIFKKV